MYVRVWVSVGVFAQVCVHASFHVCAAKCRSERVVLFTLLPPPPTCSNAAETCTRATEPAAGCVSAGEPKDGCGKGDVLN